MAKTSVYLNKERTAAIESCGRSVLELIDLGLTAEQPMRTALYLLHDQDDDLLYAGVTRNPGRRFTRHTCDKPWWPEVARKTIEWFDSRKDAEAAERAAIAALTPRYNRNDGGGGRQKTPDGKRVTWAVKLSEEEAATADALIAGHGLTRSAWLHHLVTSALSAREGRVTGQPRERKPSGKGSCPHRLPPGAYCKACAK